MQVLVHDIIAQNRYVLAILFHGLGLDAVAIER